MKIEFTKSIPTFLTALAVMILTAVVTVEADQVILDDLIVDGSACIGLDCVNGESFGFDTLRLKENNLRIKFQDTSSSASFPTNDWQLTANDSSNGGQNKFSIDDIDGGRTPFTIEAGAPSHSLYVDDGGRIGLGTNAPVVDLHVKGGNSPTLRLEQDGSSGFTPQTWDVAGNEANFFVRDVTNGSKLPFRIKPGADSDTLYLDSTGNIGFGTTSPDLNLDIEGTNPGIRLTNTGGTTQSWDLYGTGGKFLLSDVTGSTLPFQIEAATPSRALYLASTGYIGLGTSTPDAMLDIEGASSPGIRLSNTGTTPATYDIVADSATGILDFRHNSGTTTPLQVFDAGVAINGYIAVNGSVVHSDFVFDEDHEIESIEEQSAFMWENKHLPALPKAPEGLRGPVNLLEHQMGILEELEKAHIYIEQLHNNIKELELRLNRLETVAP